MSFILDAIRDRPLALIPFGGTNPYLDLSGYVRNASVSTGTPTKHIALVRGTKDSVILSESAKCVIPSPVFQSGVEAEPFSLEAIVRPINVTMDGSTTIQVLGHAGQMDGIIMSSTTVSFVCKFSDASFAKVSFDFQQGQRLHIVAVKDSDKLGLYVNGELKEEVTLSSEQKALKFSGSGTQLSLGSVLPSESTDSFAVGGVAIYPTVLSGDTVKRHYQMLSSLPDTQSVASVFGGFKMPVALNPTSIFLEQTWSSKDEWDLGVGNNTSIVNDRLVPQFEDGASLPGQWLNSVYLGTTDLTSINSVVINWDGVGGFVDVSLDGDIWERMSQGGRVATISNGWNPTGKSMLIRVVFLAGGDPAAFVDNLTVTGIQSAAPAVVNGRSITFAEVGARKEKAPLELHDNWGASIRPNGSITIGPDTTDEATATRTIEMWVKKAATNKVIDPSFETTAWDGKNARFIRDSSRAKTGAYSYKATPGTQSNVSMLTSNQSVSSGQVWRIRVWYQTSSDYNGTADNGKVRVYDQSGGLLSWSAFLPNKSTWTMAECIYTVPSDGSVTAINASLNINHTIGGLWIDDIEISDISDSNYPRPNISGATTYVNASTGIPVKENAWSLVHIVAPSDITGNLVISNIGQVGSITIYSKALSATEVEKIYNTYTGNDVVRIAEDSAVSIEESSSPVQIYAYDWSIQTA